MASRPKVEDIGGDGGVVVHVGGWHECCLKREEQKNILFQRILFLRQLKYPT